MNNLITASERWYTQVIKFHQEEISSEKESNFF